jgi:hypothetical protein
MSPHTKSYAQRWAGQIGHELWSFGVDQLVGVILAILILLYQLHAGLIAGGKQLHITELTTLAYPYLTLLGVYILLEVMRAPFVLDRQQVDRIDRLTLDLAKYVGPTLVPSMAVFLSTMGNSPTSTAAHCDVTIFNRGTEHTIIKNWQFSYRLTGETGRYRVLSIPVNLAFDPVRGVQPIGEVVVDDPGISPGGSRLYRHTYHMAQSLEEINKKGATITLRFQDINDAPYAVEVNFGFSSDAT